MASRLKEIVKKYGKVAFGVHFTVSGISIAGLYAAVKSNVDVESIIEKYQIPGFHIKEESSDLDPIGGGESRNKTKELAASAGAGGALAVALLCNKALIPIRVPITVVLTPPIARFLARRNILKTGV